MGSSAADVLNKFDSIHHLVPFYPITDFNCKSVGGSHKKNKKEKKKPAAFNYQSLLFHSRFPSEEAFLTTGQHLLKQHPYHSLEVQLLPPDAKHKLMGGNSTITRAHWRVIHAAIPIYLWPQLTFQK